MAIDNHIILKLLQIQFEFDRKLVSLKMLFSESTLQSLQEISVSNFKIK